MVRTTHAIFLMAMTALAWSMGHDTHHEDDVSDGHDSIGMDELLQDLSSRQVALEPHAACCTEGAAHLAAHLHPPADRLSKVDKQASSPTANTEEQCMLRRFHSAGVPGCNKASMHHQNGRVQHADIPV